MQGSIFFCERVSVTLLIDTSKVNFLDNVQVRCLYSVCFCHNTPPPTRRFCACSAVLTHWRSVIIEFVFVLAAAAIIRSLRQNLADAERKAHEEEENNHQEMHTQPLL